MNNSEQVTAKYTDQKEIAEMKKAFSSADFQKPKKDNFVRTLLVLIVLVVVSRLFIIEPFLVFGSSMNPTFETGDYLLVDEVTYKFHEPKRGDVVVLRPPIDKDKFFIKRIIGLPGETIIVENNRVIVKNKEFPEGFQLSEPYVTFAGTRIASKTLSPSEYFVMGDNRQASSDSRSWGALPRENIRGKALFRLLPLKEVSTLPGSTDKFSGISYPENVSAAK